jgi:hypothetical protein
MVNHRRWPIALLSCLGALGAGSRLRGAEPRPLPRFERVVIDAEFPGGYQVEVADVNGDGRPDIVGLGGGTCAWFENPSWTKRIVSAPRQTPGIISTATADIDGDGVAEIAIAYDFALDRPDRGKIVLATHGVGTSGPWTLEPIADVGSVHRLRWGDVDGDARLDLVAAPIVGPAAKAPSYDQSPARILAFRAAGRPGRGPWTAEPVGERPLVHAIKLLDLDGDGRAEVLSADNLGVTRFDRGDHGPGWSSRRLATGAPGAAPKRGSSEIQVGRLARGARFLATIDPWHGSEVAVCPANGPESFAPRIVLDSTLRDGHALWVADLDGDGDDEIIAGFRGPGTSVLAYDFDGKTWTRTVLDNAIAAQDLRGGDLDGDGTPDFVAIGGKTHNIVWYRPKKE